LCTGVLLRRRETGSQIGLTSHQRRENMRGAFAVSDPTRILKRDILLIDDVVTTGTTVSECARVLLRAGAARVWVATVARTLKISDLVFMPEVVDKDRNEAVPEILEDDGSAEGSDGRLDVVANG
jgi:hypoxanthine phosphoribosyltransferase